MVLIELKAGLLIHLVGHEISDKAFLRVRVSPQNRFGVSGFLGFRAPRVRFSDIGVQEAHPEKHGKLCFGPCTLSTAH